MAYSMFSAMHNDHVQLSCIKHTAREVRQEITSNLFPTEGWAAAKKAGWKVIRVWVGLERRYG
jgi:hypothetical protein